MPSDVDIQNLSPDHQLRSFSKSPFMRNLLLAAMLHIIVIGGTSAGMLVKEDEEKDAEEKESDQIAKVEDDAADADATASDQQSDAASADASAAAESADAEAGKGDASKEGEQEREPSEYEKKHMMDKEAPPTSPDASDIDISLDEYGL